MATYKSQSGSTSHRPHGLWAIAGAEGHLERHIRRMRWSKTGPKGPSHYDRQRQAMVTALQTHFGDRATILGENAGLHMMVRFQTKMPDAELIARAEQVGVGLISAAPQYLGDSSGHEFIFSYTELDEAAIATGIAKLASIGHTNPASRLPSDQFRPAGR